MFFLCCSGVFFQIALKWPVKGLMIYFDQRNEYNQSISLTQLLHTQTYQLAKQIVVTIGSTRSSHMNEHTCLRTSDFSFISPRGLMVKMFKMTEVTWQSYLHYTYYRRRPPLGKPRIKHFAQGHNGDVRFKELFSSWITRVFQRLPAQIFNQL